MSEKIDRQLLHEFLYKKSNSRNVLRVLHTDLAEDLGVGHYTISRIFREFIREGRVKKLDHGRQGVDYLIRDPEDFQE